MAVSVPAARVRTAPRCVPMKTTAVMMPSSFAVPAPAGAVKTYGLCPIASERFIATGQVVRLTAALVIVRINLEGKNEHNRKQI